MPQTDITANTRTAKRILHHLYQATSTKHSTAWFTPPLKLLKDQQSNTLVYKVVHVIYTIDLEADNKHRKERADAEGRFAHTMA